MFKYLILTLCLVFSLLLGMYFYVGVPTIYPGEDMRVRNVHHAINLEQPISKIHLTAFYFVPKNKQENVYLGWQKILQEKLATLVDFHAIQLQGESSIEYTIYPEPIIGNLDNVEYDTFITQHGNPEALRRIVPEIEERVFKASGDLYRSDSANVPGDSYHVLVIMYEGVGATGGDNVALISRTFLTEAEYADASGSLLAHEFYHTLGLPDEYTVPEGIATSQNIMGLGRFRPITQTFLSANVLRKLGL